MRSMYDLELVARCIASKQAANGRHEDMHSDGQRMVYRQQKIAEWIGPTHFQYFMIGLIQPFGWMEEVYNAISVPLVGYRSFVRRGHTLYHVPGGSANLDLTWRGNPDKWVTPCKPGGVVNIYWHDLGD